MSQPVTDTCHSDQQWICATSFVWLSLAVNTITGLENIMQSQT